ncbi:kinase-like domain-containing protein [Amylostereum chailletii]|nr:kinase-like domain-containing protein [Amylostereum chailletii]
MGGDEYCNNKIAPDVGLSEDTAHFYFRQILDGVRFIHGEGVCHRDLKPENLLLDAAGKVKISDFGLSSVYKLKETGRTRMLSDRCGSLPYVAPELNSTEPYEAEPIDVWGVGVILFTMLVGNTPWDEPTKRSREFNRYVSGAYLNDDPWTRLSDQAHSLITGLLTIHPQDRFTLEYAQQHPWVLPESQLAPQSPEAVAERLTQSLRDNGDLALANPDLSPSSNEDEDTVMLSATRGSQFVNSLLLFSQSQYGTRYTKQLTRFYATIPPGELFIRIEEALAELGVKSKRGPVDAKSQTARMRVGGLDNRNVAYKGWIDVEPFATLDCPSARTYCVLSRDEGDPLSWRRLFKALVAAPQVMPHLLVRNK